MLLVEALFPLYIAESLGESILINMKMKIKINEKESNNIKLKDKSKSLLRSKNIFYFFKGSDNSIAIIQPYLPKNVLERINLSKKLKIGYKIGKRKVFLKGTKANVKR